MISDAPRLEPLSPMRLNHRRCRSILRAPMVGRLELSPISLPSAPPLPQPQPPVPLPRPQRRRRRYGSVFSGFAPSSSSIASITRFKSPPSHHHRRRRCQQRRRRPRWRRDCRARRPLSAGISGRRGASSSSATTWSCWSRSMKSGGETAAALSRHNTNDAISLGLCQSPTPPPPSARSLCDMSKCTKERT